MRGQVGMHDLELNDLSWQEAHLRSNACKWLLTTISLFISHAWNSFVQLHIPPSYLWFQTTDANWRGGNAEGGYLSKSSETRAPGTVLLSLRLWRVNSKGLWAYFILSPNMSTILGTLPAAYIYLKESTPEYLRAMWTKKVFFLIYIL